MPGNDSDAEAVGPPDEFDPEDYDFQDLEENEPHFHLGEHGRPAAMPTPPGAEVVDSEPVTTHRSKRVMLRAERNDEIEIELVVAGMSNVPKTMTVIERRETYYGTNLMCHAEVGGEDTNWCLTCPGPNTQLILWKAATGMNGKYRSGWIPVSEVRAQISDTTQYRICDHCGEPLRDIWHERLAVFGACQEHARGEGDG